MKTALTGILGVCVIAWWLIGVIFATSRFGLVGLFVTTLGFPFGWVAAIFAAFAVSPWLFLILGFGIAAGAGLFFLDRKPATS